MILKTCDLVRVISPRTVESQSQETGEHAKTEETEAITMAITMAIGYESLQQLKMEYKKNIGFNLKAKKLVL